MLSPGAAREEWAISHLLPGRTRRALRPGSWARQAVNWPFLDVKPAFSGHCALLFTACLWGLLINRSCPTVYFLLSVVLGHIFKLHAAANDRAAGPRVDGALGGGGQVFKASIQAAG